MSPKIEPTPKRHPCPAAARASPYPGYLPDGLTACDRGARPVGGSPAALPGPVHHVTITVGRGTHPLGQGVRLGQQCQVLSTGLGADSLWPASAPPWWCTALMSYARAPPPPCRPSRPVRCSPTPSAPGSQGCRALRPRAVLARVHRRRALQARRADATWTAPIRSLPGCGEHEWAEGSFANPDGIVYSIEEDGRLAAAGNLTPFRGHPADVGLAGRRPDDRRRAGRRRPHPVPRAGQQRTFAGVARSLGFAGYGRNLMARLPG